MTTRTMAWGLGGVVCFVALSACDGGSILNNVGDTPEGGTAGNGAVGNGSSQAGSSSFSGAGGRRNGGGGDSGGGDVGGGNFGGANGVAGGGFGGGGSGGTGGFDGFGGFVDGAGPVAGTGGGSFGGGSFGGGSFGGGSFGGGSFGGSASGSTGEGGSSGNFPGCFAPFQVDGQGDQLELGPQNSVLLDAHAASNSIRNSANQSIFPNVGNIWEVYANFPATTPAVAAKTDIMLPAQLATVPENLGQLYITRQACAGLLVAGRKLKVEVWWKPATTFTGLPTHGVALGVVGANDATSWLDDAKKAFVVGDAAAQSNLETLNRIVLQHTFEADDLIEANKLVLGLWLLDDQVFPTNFYIGNVQWD